MHLGIDLGTSGVKTVLTGPGGEVLAQASAPLSVAMPHRLWREQDPAELLIRPSQMGRDLVLGRVGDAVRERARRYGREAGQLLSLSRAGHVLRLRRRRPLHRPVVGEVGEALQVAGRDRDGGELLGLEDRHQVLGAGAGREEADQQQRDRRDERRMAPAATAREPGRESRRPGPRPAAGFGIRAHAAQRRARVHNGVRDREQRGRVVGIRRDLAEAALAAIARREVPGCPIGRRERLVVKPSQRPVTWMRHVLPPS